MLLDVRENGGGEFHPWFISHLTDRPFNVGTRYFHKRPSFKDTPDWIDEIDMGSDYMSDHAAKFFSTSPDAATSPKYPFLCRTEKCDVSEAIYKPADSSKTFDFIVLSGPYCASSCDQFLDIVKDNNMGKIAGLPSRGAQSIYYHEEKFSLLDGTQFSIGMNVGTSLGPDGKETDGNPSAIDIPIPPTRENRANYLDYVLAKLVGTSSSPSIH